MMEEPRKHAARIDPPTQPGTGSLTIARAYLEAGALNDAEAVIRRLLEEHAEGSPESLLILADCLFRQGRIEEAQVTCDDLRTRADARLSGELHLLEAQLLVHSGRFRDCIQAYEGLVQTPAASIEDIKLGSVLALCYARLENTKMARHTLERTIADSERLGWIEGIADGLTAIALLDRIEGHWSRADGLLLQARDTYRSLGIARKYVKATLNLGLQRLWRGHLTFAEDALREAVRLAVEMGDPAIEATARADRGLALVRLDRTTEARAELAKSLRLCRRQASPRRTAIALEYTGELHIACRKYVRATAALRRALAIANRIAPDGDIIPEVLRRQAEVALAVGDAGEALRLAQDAAARAERYGDRYEYATALRVQGQALWSQDPMAPGEPLLRSALAILDELGETFERDRILALLGELDDAPTEVAAIPAALTGSTAGPSSDPPDRRVIRELSRRHGLFGSSRRLMDVMREAYQVSSLDIPVLVQGETGTGKELLAQAIHRMGRWANGPLVAFNCATCPPDLLDAELFGHTRGAYTGAVSSRTGLVRAAEGGTLFLDEIGELREESQARLLRFLDSGEVRPLGSDVTVRVPVRILAATHVDLDDRVRRNRFRRDLYYRLTGLRLALPALRDRRSDIKELVSRFTSEARSAIRPAFAGLSEAAIREMERAPWPGNIRQLKSEIFRLAALTGDGIIVNVWAPPEGMRSPGVQEAIADAGAVLDDPRELWQMISRYGGRVAEVASVLGVSRSHVYRVLKHHGLHIKAVRDDH